MIYYIFFSRMLYFGECIRLNSRRPGYAYVRRRTGLIFKPIMAPIQRQAITWNKADVLPIRSMGTNVNDILIESQTISLK